MLFPSAIRSCRVRTCLIAAILLAAARRTDFALLDRETVLHYLLAVPVGVRLLGWVTYVAISSLVIFGVARMFRLKVKYPVALKVAVIAGVPGLIEVLALHQFGSSLLAVAVLLLVYGLASVIVTLLAINLVLKSGFEKTVALFLVMMLAALAVGAVLRPALYHRYSKRYGDIIHRDLQSRF